MFENIYSLYSLVFFNLSLNEIYLNKIFYIFVFVFLFTEHYVLQQILIKHAHI